MIINEREDITVQTASVSPGEVVRYNSDYWIRADGTDEYGDPMFVNLRNGVVDYPGVYSLCVPIRDARAVV